MARRDVVQVRSPKALKRPEDSSLGGVDFRQAASAYVTQSGRTKQALAGRGVALLSERQPGAELCAVVVPARLSSSQRVDPLGEDAERSAVRRELWTIAVERRHHPAWHDERGPVSCRLLGVGQRPEDVARDHDIERAIRICGCLGVADGEVDGEPKLVRSRDGSRQHTLRQVDGRDVVTEPSSKQCHDSRASADIEHAQPSRDPVGGIAEDARDRDAPDFLDPPIA